MDTLTKPRADSPRFAPWLRETMTRGDFDALPGDDLQALGRFGTRRTCRPGVTIFRQGDQPKQVFGVESGVVELAHETQFEHVVVQLVHAGSIVDDIAIVLGAPYSYTAVAVTRATIVQVRVDTVRMLTELFPEMTVRWLRLMAGSLGQAHERILELSGKSALEQVAHFLLHESSKHRDPTVELTQDGVASSLGLSRQTVSRVLRELAQEQAVERARGRIRIVDPARLRVHLPR